MVSAIYLKIRTGRIRVLTIFLLTLVASIAFLSMQLVNFRQQCFKLASNIRVKFNTNSRYSNDCDSKVECIPRYLHFIWFKDEPTPLRFHHLITLLAAVRFFQPKIIFFWHDTVPTNNYWYHFVATLPQSCQLLMKKRKRPREVFGNPINVVEHQSDILRLQVYC